MTTLEKVLAYWKGRLSAPQYDEFSRVMRDAQDVSVSTATRRYWLGVVEELADCVPGATEDEVFAFVDGLA